MRIWTLAWTWRLLGGAAALVGAVVVLAACGAGSRGPGVAGLGTATGSAATGDAATPDARAYAHCMRAHGITNFPDPDSSGGYAPGALKGIDRDSPQFRSALDACRSLRPPGIAEEVIQDQPQLLKFTACMRAHGEPEFPDIGAESTRRSVSNAIKALDPNSAQFQSALTACRHLLPANLANLGGQ